MARFVTITNASNGAPTRVNVDHVVTYAESSSSLAGTSEFSVCIRLTDGTEGFTRMSLTALDLLFMGDGEDV